MLFIDFNVNHLVGLSLGSAVGNNDSPTLLRERDSDDAMSRPRDRTLSESYGGYAEKDGRDSRDRHPLRSGIDNSGLMSPSSVGVGISGGFRREQPRALSGLTTTTTSTLSPAWTKTGLPGDNTVGSGVGTKMSGSIPPAPTGGTTPKARFGVY